MGETFSNIPLRAIMRTDRTTAAAGNSVWGDDWIHERQHLLLVPQARDLDDDELVFFVPGTTLPVCADDRVTHFESPDEALRWSMQWRTNAAYVAPKYACFHEQFSIAAWFGVLASGRAAWLPVSFASRIMDAGFAEVCGAANKLFERDMGRWRLERRVRSVARRVNERGASRVVSGLKLHRRAGCCDVPLYLQTKVPPKRWGSQHATAHS